MQPLSRALWVGGCAGGQQGGITHGAPRQSRGNPRHDAASSTTAEDKDKDVLSIPPRVWQEMELRLRNREETITDLEEALQATCKVKIYTEG